jgi:8-oxo-dGTP diphosphatase
VGAVVAGTDAADAAIIPVSDVLSGRQDVAFDHLRILRDALERVRVEFEVSGVATAFVGPTFTLSELRAVYESVWDTRLDSANFRRSIVSEGGWVIPTGRRARPGAAGGKPAELFRAGSAWKRGGPIRRPQRAQREK